MPACHAVTDEAFSFVYPHLVRGWRDAGAEIAAFSPLADEPPPTDCDACWLPGGYPELHAGRLEIAHFIDNARVAGTSGRSQPVFNSATGVGKDRRARHARGGRPRRRRRSRSLADLGEDAVAATSSHPRPIQDHPLGAGRPASRSDLG